MLKHYNPKPSVIVERFKLNSHNRQDGESVAAYVAQQQGKLQSANMVNEEKVTKRKNIGKEHSHNKPIYISVKLNKQVTQMQVDTGASVSIISEVNVPQSLGKTAAIVVMHLLQNYIHTLEKPSGFLEDYNQSQCS